MACSSYVGVVPFDSCVPGCSVLARVSSVAACAAADNSRQHTRPRGPRPRRLVTQTHECMSRAPRFARLCAQCA
eukprot:4254818-Prymnesium_polylepis.1